MNGEYRDINRTGPQERYDPGPMNLGGRYTDSDWGENRWRDRGDDRGWFDRATDEVTSWFGDDDAERRRGMDERRGEGWGGYSESGYRRTDRYDDRDRDRRGGRRREETWETTRAREVMTRDVVRVHPHDSVRYAARLMEGYDCGALPVVDWQNRLIGMITDRDIAIRAVANRRNAEQTSVGEAMTEGAFSCHAGDSLRDCLSSMKRHQIRRIPIVDDNNRVVGIVSQADIALRATRGRQSSRAFTNVVKEISEPNEDSHR